MHCPIIKSKVREVPSKARSKHSQHRRERRGPHQARFSQNAKASIFTLNADVKEVWFHKNIFSKFKPLLK